MADRASITAQIIVTIDCCEGLLSDERDGPGVQGSDTLVMKSANEVN